LITGGSDYHGVETFIPLGWMGKGISLSYDAVKKMKDSLKNSEEEVL